MTVTLHRMKRRHPRTHQALSVLVVGLLGFGLSHHALADVQAIAESLYAEGRRLMASGKTASACAKFDESYQLAPATGTLLNLAACNEAMGKSATAWAQFRKAEVAAHRDGRADRVQFAQEHRARLEQGLSYLTIVTSPTEAAAGLQITLDDMVLGPAAWNISIPVDPGERRIVARLPHDQPRVFRVVIKAGDRTAKIDVSVVQTAPTGVPSPAPPDSSHPTGKDSSRGTP